MRSQRKGLKLLALIAGLSMLAAACGSDDEGGSSTTEGGPPAGGAAGGDFIDIGTFVGDPPEHLDPALNSTLDAYQVINAMYDGLTDTWSIEHLSVPRRWVTAAEVGGKAYFAGGRTPAGVLSDRLDIYDPATGEWTIATLPEAQNYAAGAGGDKLLLWSYANCHILNTLTGEWETKTFPASRGLFRSIVTTPDEVWFIGGSDYLDTIDIYRIADGTWSTNNTAVVHSNHLACYLNGKIIIASGRDAAGPSTIVETFDTEAGEWLDLAELSEGRHWFTNGNLIAPVIGNQAFFPGGLVDVSYDEPTSTMDIYSDLPSSLFTPILQHVSIQAFPSPFSETLHVHVDFEKPARGTLEIYDLSGRLVFLENMEK